MTNILPEAKPKLAQRTASTHEKTRTRPTTQIVPARPAPPCTTTPGPCAHIPADPSSYTLSLRPYCSPDIDNSPPPPPIYHVVRTRCPDETVLPPHLQRLLRPTSSSHARTPLAPPKTACLPPSFLFCPSTPLLVQ